MGRLWLSVISERFPGTEPVRLLEGTLPAPEPTVVAADVAEVQRPTAA